jgi:hypothetical protein
MKTLALAVASSLLPAVRLRGALPIKGLWKRRWPPMTRRWPQKSVECVRAHFCSVSTTTKTLVALFAAIGVQLSAAIGVYSFLPPQVTNSSTFV